MRGGNNKLPPNVHDLRGTARKDRMNPDEPKLDGKLPTTPPEWLAPMAKRHYRKLAGILWWLTDADADKLALYCQAYARYREYTKLLGSLDLDHEVFKEWEVKDVVLILNSLPIRLRDAETAMRGLGSELGMDPVSRTRIHAKKPGEVDTFDQWENKRA